LHAKFLEKNCDERRKIESKISDGCLEFLKKLDEIKNFKNHFNVDFSYSNLHIEKNDNREITEILKAMENSFFSEMKFSICSKLNICSVPNFLIKNFKKNLKQKIRKFWKLNYEIPIINLLLESKFGFKFLKEKFRDLIDERLNIFDARYFTHEFRITLFKFFVVVNLDSMKKNKLNLQTFLNNFKKYVYLMGLHDKYEYLINLVVDLTSFEDENYLNKQKILIDNFCEEFLKVFFPYIKLNKEDNNLVFGLPNGIKDHNLRNEELLNLNFSNYEKYFIFKNDNVNNNMENNDFMLFKSNNEDNKNYNKNNIEEKIKSDLMSVFIGDKTHDETIKKNSDKIDLFKDFYNFKDEAINEEFENKNKDNREFKINYNVNKEINYNILDFFSSNLNQNGGKNESTENKCLPVIDVSDETKLLTVFSFSIMLNNLMTICLVEDNQPVEDSELTNIKILFTPNLKCSSRERNFLINTLFALEFYNNMDFKVKKLNNNAKMDKITNIKNLDKNLDRNNSFSLLQDDIQVDEKDKIKDDLKNQKNEEEEKFSYIETNYMMENSILSELVKSYSKVLFDESNKQKLVLNNEKIFDIFYNFNENDSIIEDYETFLKINIDLSGENPVKKITSKLKNFYSNISNKFRKSSNQIMPTDKRIKLELNNLKFIPLDPISISPHLCLCISGGFIQDTYKENFWLNFGLDDKVMDYYFMNWQDDYYKAGFFDSFMDAFNLKSYEGKIQEYKNAFKKNKKTAKGYGKILAYLVASRYIFFKSFYKKYLN